MFQLCCLGRPHKRASAQRDKAAEPSFSIDRYRQRALTLGLWLGPGSLLKARSPRNGSSPVEQESGYCRARNRALPDVGIGEHEGRRHGIEILQNRAIKQAGAQDSGVPEPQ